LIFHTAHHMLSNKQSRHHFKAQYLKKYQIIAFTKTKSSPLGNLPFFIMASFPIDDKIVTLAHEAHDLDGKISIRAQQNATRIENAPLHKVGSYSWMNDTELEGMQHRLEDKICEISALLPACSEKVRGLVVRQLSGDNHAF